MRLRKLIKEFWFREEDRRITTLGTSVRISPCENHLTLKSTNGVFPLATNLYAKTRLTNPKSVKAWIGFQVDIVNKKDSAGSVVTSAGYRLSDNGTNELWWNGSDWVPASPGEWNTEAEIAANIQTFPVLTQSIQVIVNPRTTNVKCAPEITRVKVLYDSDLEWEEEYIARSLLPALREEILPIAEYELAATEGQTEVNLSAIETPYAIDSVDSAFNTTLDPFKLSNIAGSYDSGTKILALALPASNGDRLRIRFVYKPLIALARSQDYTELSQVPAVVIESVTFGDTTEVSTGESVINKATGEGWQQDVGAQCDIDIGVRWIADKQLDADRLSDQVKQFFDERLLRARGQDEFFALCIVDSYNSQTTAAQSELHTGRLRARLYRAIFYVQPAKPVFAVKRMLAQGDTNFQVP